MLSPVPVETFGGLNLTEDPATAGWNQAIDALNVDLDKRGRLRSRNGYVHLTSLAAASAYFHLFAPGPVASKLLASRGDQIDAIAMTGAVSATLASTASGISSWTFANFGTPSNSYTYCQNWGATTRRWDGSAFASPTATINGVAGGAMPKVEIICAWPTQSRLVAAGGSGTQGPGGSTTSAHHVWFSEAGNAESWLTTNFVQLMPGDNEAINNVVSWNNNIYVIKKTRMFEFYGVSADSSGNPIFNYRTIDLPSRGLGPFNYETVTVSPGGIFIATERGIYRYNGTFQLVSAAIDPIWLNTADSFYQGIVRDVPGVVANLFWTDERLYVVLVNNAGTYRTLVWDSRIDAWLYWDAPARVFAQCQEASNTEKRITFASATANHVDWFNSSLSTDNGSSITSRYRSGFSDLGTTDMKRIHSWRLQGSGTPTLKVSADFGSLETGATVTLGTAPAIAEGVRRYAPRGRQFSWQVGGTGAWSLNNLYANVAGKRQSGEHVAP